MKFQRVIRLAALITIVGSLLLPFGSGSMFAPHVASAALPGVNGKIAFASWYAGDYQIYVMNADGTGQTNLTGQMRGYYPVWSPDGSKIAFLRYIYDGSTLGLWVMNANGSGTVLLTYNSVSYAQPSWSPDGTKIAFTSNRDGNSEIYVMNAADGSEQTNVTNNTAIDSDPSWSPDGTRIAFTSHRNYNTDIYVMNADGTEQTNLTPGYNSVADCEPDWSPDGTKIAFARSIQSDPNNSSYDIYVMNADGTNVTRLTNELLYDDYPAWSPDGAKIAYHHGASSSFEIRVIDLADPSAPPAVLTPVGLNVYPSWGVPSPENVNVPPTVGAGGPYSGNEGAAIPLTGTASDPDGDSLTYTWTYEAVSGVDSGAACSFSASTAKSTNFTCTDDGVFRVTLTANDSHNPAVSTSANVTVSNVKPKVSITAPAASALYKVGDTVTISAPFTDDGKNDTHSATINWDDGAGPVAGSVTETAGSGSGTVSGTKSFASAGVYTAKVAVADDDNGEGAATVMLVVYDPTAGFVTGGGWIDTLPGSYAADRTIAGRADFGFVSKYQKGAAIPVGQTEFWFQVADFSFYSDRYQWLVVAGPKAQYKGTGTVNGVSGYSFLLTATDGQASGGGNIDKFRIKIWNSSDNSVIYDNVLGTSDDIDSANPQAIGGGNIVIHAK